MSLAPQVESESPPRPPIKTFDSLGNYAFRWYFFSMSGWFASMNMQMIARGWLAYDLTGSYAALGVTQCLRAEARDTPTVPDERDAAVGDDPPTERVVGETNLCESERVVQQVEREDWR